MKIDKQKLDIALARQCKSLTELRTDLAPKTLMKIRNGEDLRTKTVGRLAQLLNCDPLDIVAEKGAVNANLKL